MKWIQAKWANRFTRNSSAPMLFEVKLGSVAREFLKLVSLEELLRVRGWKQGKLTHRQVSRLGQIIRKKILEQRITLPRP